MSVDRLERVYIKLGCGCNLNCKYCHAEYADIRFNPKILPVLKGLDPKYVTFGGGEPLLYWDVVEDIVSFLGDSVVYNLATNGTLLTRRIVDFANRHNMKFAVSLDGVGSTRDASRPIRWDLVKELKFCGTACVFYRENSDIFKSLSSLNGIKRDYLSVKPVIFSSFPNFVHSTRNTGSLSDRELADSYVVQMTAMVKRAFGIYKENGGHGTFFLGRCFNQFVRRKRMNGVNCCRDTNILMLVDGTVCACPYTLVKVGDIFHLDDIDWGKVKETYSREECKDCGIYDVCGNSCCMEVTDNQCYIMRRMNRNMLALMEANGVSYGELADKFDTDETNRKYR